MARAAGLKNIYGSVGNFKASKACQLKANLGDLLGTYTNHVGLIPNDPSGKAYPARTTMMTEKDSYAMLARGNAPQSEPFREWVFGEVLPSIRLCQQADKTGSYNVNESETEVGQQFAGELAELHAFMTGSILGTLMANHVISPPWVGVW